MYREVIADVAHVSRTEERVADGMDEHVGIAVSEQSLRMLNPDTAEP